MVTTGLQSAQDIAAKVLCDPRDVILVGDPTYLGALNTFEVYQVNLDPLAVDDQGIIPES